VFYFRIYLNKVPISKLAFMPGKLVHTNEILVLLGDNWFVEKSAKQARDVVSRRLVGVEKHLEELHKEKNIIESQFKWTADVMAV
jgi:unconventional prefoldin RPB5 interactor 1